MKIETINKLCCPFDKADLNLTIVAQEVDGNVTEGFLVCQDCQRLYPFIKGIPIMNPDEYRVPELEKPIIDRWREQLGGNALDGFKLVGR